MQTFLPYEDFQKSASVLDYRRLGKQRVEVKQILLANFQGPIKGDRKTPWYNHPACRMWRGYEGALIAYGIAICEEWSNRGYVDNIYSELYEMTNRKLNYDGPPWLGRKDFHDSHKSNLLYKQYSHYKQFNWNVPLNLPYVWPV